MLLDLCPPRLYWIVLSFLAAFYKCFILDEYRTQKVQERVVEEYLFSLMFAANRFKTKNMRNEVLKKCPWSLIYVVDWLVPSKTLENVNNDNDIKGLVEWFDDYKQCKAQKAQIEDELLYSVASIKLVGMASIKLVRLVCARRSEQRDRKVV